ncbi:MAG: YggU family protein [Magnetococcales bacterium]|nr:YggU family protein [Magnetococcales bacterium]
MTTGCWRGEDWLLDVRVQPRSSREKIIGIQGGRVKIALTSPPVEGAANRALCQLIAKALGVAKGRVTIVKGEKSREKRVCVQGVDREMVRQFGLNHGLENKAGTGTDC